MSRGTRPSLRYGQGTIFTTPRLPAVSLGSVKAIISTAATLGGNVNPQGSPATYQFEYGKTTSYGTKVPVSPKEVGSGYSPVAVSEALSGLSPNTKYHFRLSASNGIWTEYTWAVSFTTYKALPSYSQAIGSKGTTNGKLEQPHDVAVDLSGNVYVADTGNNRVQKFSAEDEFLGKFASKGTGAEQFETPRHLRRFQ